MEGFYFWSGGLKPSPIDPAKQILNFSDNILYLSSIPKHFLPSGLKPRNIFQDHLIFRIKVFQLIDDL